MRVLMAMAGARQGGAEGFFERLARALAADGVDTRAAIRSDAARAARLRAGGVPVAELAFGGAFDVATPLRLAAAMRRDVPDVALAFMSRAADKLPPRFLTGPRPVRVGRLGGYYDLKYYKNCDRLVGNTPDIRDWIVRQGWPAARVDYLPNFVDATRAPALDRAALDTPADAPLLLALGRLHENKAFDVLLDALADLPGVYLWLGGAGPLDAALRAQAARLGIASRVRFLGWREDIGALIAACDVFACPSRHEPLGNVVIEAWARAKPVVAAASAGPAALIRDGEIGLLVPVDDAPALAAAVRRVLASDELRGRLASAGEAAYQANYTQEAVVRLYRDYFRSVAG
jgi:glycosyltransferase involved in cell wall biosynthesis